MYKLKECPVPGGIPVLLQARWPLSPGEQAYAVLHTSWSPAQNELFWEVRKYLILSFSIWKYFWMGKEKSLRDYCARHSHQIRPQDNDCKVMKEDDNVFEAVINSFLFSISTSLREHLNLCFYCFLGLHSYRTVPFLFLWLLKWSFYEQTLSLNIS